MNTNLESFETLLTMSSEIPFLGKIAAGNPIDAIADPQYFDLKKMLFGPNRFILRVCGDSMIDDHICNGDYIVCERRQTAENGMIVVALINGEETILKRFQKNSDGTITLISANSEYSPLHFNSEQVEIQGIYLGLFRIGLGKLKYS